MAALGAIVVIQEGTMKPSSAILFLVLVGYLVLLRDSVSDDYVIRLIEKGDGSYLSHCHSYSSVSAYRFAVILSSVPSLIGLGVILGFRFRLNAGWSLLVFVLFVIGQTAIDFFTC